MHYHTELKNNLRLISVGVEARFRKYKLSLSLYNHPESRKSFVEYGRYDDNSHRDDKRRLLIVCRWVILCFWEYKEREH